MIQIIKGKSNFVSVLEKDKFIISYLNSYSTSVLKPDPKIFYLVDGWPIQLYLFLKLKEKVELLAYRDYCVHLFEKKDRNFIIYGYEEDELKLIVKNMRQRNISVISAIDGYKSIEVATQHIKSQFIDSSTIILIGQGQPKQEASAAKLKEYIPNFKILCVGAGLSQQFGTSNALPKFRLATPFVRFFNRPDELFMRTIFALRFIPAFFKYVCISK